MGRYLLVANQTLGGAELEQKIQDRCEAGHSEFYVVVPMIEPTAEAAGWVPADPSFGVPTPPPTVLAEAREEARRRSEHRLDRILDKIRVLGGEADGRVDERDPFDAAIDALERGNFDEIIISTLPPGISRWLKMDLPSRVSRKANVPVTTVEAED